LPSAAPVAVAPTPAAPIASNVEAPRIPAKCLGPEPGGFAPTGEETSDEPHCRPNGVEERKVRAALLKQYDKQWTHSSVEVSFDCDPIFKPLRFVAHESSLRSYYALSLLWRDGDRFRSLEVRVRGSIRRKGEPPPRTVFVKRGSVPVASVDALRGRLRAYFSARIREVEAEDPGFPSRHSRLSSDPIETLYLVDEGNGRLARRFDGQWASDEQSQSLPFSGAADLLKPAFGSATTDVDAASPREIRAIAEWAWSLRWGIHGERPGAAEDRAAALARVVETRQWVPLLLHALYLGSVRERLPNESIRRPLAKLTGLDLRLGPDGAPLDAEALGHAYYDACAPAYGLPSGSPP